MKKHPEIQKLEEKYGLEIERDDVEIFELDDPYIKTIFIEKYLRKKDLPKDKKEDLLRFVSAMKRASFGSFNIVLLGNIKNNWKLKYHYIIPNGFEEEPKELLEYFIPGVTEKIFEMIEIESFFTKEKQKNRISRSAVTKNYVKKSDDLLKQLDEKINKKIKEIIILLEKDLKEMAAEIKELLRREGERKCGVKTL